MWDIEFDYLKWRYVLKGGDDFKNKYLIKFSERETQTEFDARRKMTPVPAHAKTNLIEIRNSIYERMPDIKRTGGSVTFQKAIAGELGGVDLKGNTLSYFIGMQVLLELLAMSKVGIYVDNHRNPGPTRADSANKHPYLYMYTAENIINYHYDEQNQLTALMLRDVDHELDSWGLPSLTPKISYRYLQLVENGVRLVKLNASKNPVGEEYMLDLPRIPFTLLEISDSLLREVSDYQIAMMNLESSDISYALKSNFPFYIEQFVPNPEDLLRREGASTAGKDAKVGTTTGRRYPKGMDAPSFIAPPSEPLEVSMKKQDQMEATIRKMMHLSLSQIQAVRSSQESKQEDRKGLQSGLSYISMELERGERDIARHWAGYENSNPAYISYPRSYTEESEEQAIEKADKKLKFMPLASQTGRKELAKQIMDLILGKQVDPDTRQKIKDEIDGLDVVMFDAEDIREDVEAGLVDRATGSKARGYPAGVVDIAKQEHTERLKEIAIAQSSAGARGTDEQDNESGKLEKKRSQDRDKDPNGRKRVRR